MPPKVLKKVQPKKINNNHVPSSDDSDDDIFGRKAPLKKNKSSKGKQELNECIVLLDEIENQDQKSSKSKLKEEVVELCSDETDDSFDLDDFDKPPEEYKRKFQSSEKLPPIPGKGKRRSKRKRKGKEPDVDYFEELNALEIDKQQCEALSRGDDLVEVVHEISPTKVEDELDVKFRIRGKFHKICMKRKASFFTVLQDLSEVLNVSRNEVGLSLNDESLSFDETPEKLELSISDVIDCFKKEAPKGSNCGPVDVNSISVKLRRHIVDKRNHEDITVLRINKLSKLVDLMAEYANKIELPIEQLKFEFDGDIIDGSETPESLNMEDESMIDVLVKS